VRTCKQVTIGWWLCFSNRNNKSAKSATAASGSGRQKWFQHRRFAKRWWLSATCSRTSTKQTRQNFLHVGISSQWSSATVSAQNIDRGFFVHKEYKDFETYLAQQHCSGTWCDELMFRCISDVLNRQIVIFDENGYKTVIVPPTSNNSDCSTSRATAPLYLGLMTNFHYLSFVPLDGGYGCTSSSTSNLLAGSSTCHELAHEMVSDMMAEGTDVRDTCRRPHWCTCKWCWVS